MSAANIKDIVANKRGYKYPYIKVNQISGYVYNNKKFTGWRYDACIM